MKTLFKAIALIFILSVVGIPQANRGITIQGHIRDAHTGAPLLGVNVFLAHTTLGAASDEKGNYTIKNVPPGLYRIVFSYVGYEKKVLVVKASLEGDHISVMNVALNAKPVELTDVVIEGENSEWRKNIKRFTRIFLGDTYNSHECKILNPEVIDVKVNPETDEITASTDSLIIVENRALGYRIEVLLKKFSWESDDEGAYTVLPHFIEMKPSNINEYKKWRENRYETYVNSYRYFLSSLVLNKLRGTHFHMYISDVNSRFNSNSINMRTSIPRRSLDSQSPVEINASDIESVLIDSVNYIKRFLLGKFLKVTYGTSPDAPATYIKFKYNYADIDSSGNDMTPLGLIMDGFWGTMRIADSLPFDYRPRR